MNLPRTMVNTLRALLVALTVAVLSGCAPLQAGLSKAVLMDYDQPQNFRQYEFLPINQPQWNNNTQAGIDGYFQGPPTVIGFWATFIICSVRNEGSEAEPFPFKMENFYVTYEGKDHYYKPLAPYTFSSYPQNVPADNLVTPLVNEKFRLETVLGEEVDTFQKNTYAPSVNYRFAIHVTRSQQGGNDTNTPLSLRYKNYPNIMNSRNQMPQTKSTPTKKADLATTCRPSA